MLYNCELEFFHLPVGFVRYLFSLAQLARQKKILSTPPVNCKILIINYCRKTIAMLAANQSITLVK